MMHGSVIRAASRNQLILLGFSTPRCGVKYAYFAAAT